MGSVNRHHAMHDFSIAAWNPWGGAGVQFATSSPTYTHARAPTGGITIQGKFYRGGMWIPKEVLEGAAPEEKQHLAAAGIMPQGGVGGDPSMNTGSQLPGSAGDDPGGGPMGPPLPPPPPPRTRPRRVTNATASIPPGQTEPHSQAVNAAAGWLRSASAMTAQLDPNDENAWVRLGAGPDMLPGLMLSALSARGHMAGKMMARGFVQQLGPQFPMIAGQVLPRLPAVQLLGAITQHPEVQRYLASYSLDPRGETLADQRVLWRAVRTAADDPSFGTLAGQAMAQAVLSMLQPPMPQENPDLVGRV